MECFVKFWKLCRVLSTESESHSLGGVSKQMFRVKDILTGCFKVFSSIQRRGNKILIILSTFEEALHQDTEDW